MILDNKTLEQLRLLINEETEYRSGKMLVKFFNDLGFNDSYGQGFPSRWVFTDEKLIIINGKPELDKCIKKLFDPRNFIGRFNELDRFIEKFNQYLAFDKWKIIRKDAEITFQRLEKITIETHSQDIKIDDFLAKEFDEIPLDKIGIDASIVDIIRLRFEEIRNCLNSNAPLSVIFLSGSSLEGILLGVALNFPKEFNQSRCSPKQQDGKVKQFPEWSLSNFIDVAHDVGFIMEDVKKFSHSLRDFRNYIHPYEQFSSKFNPDINTANISWQVLKTAIYQISKKTK